jgi:hypothetical protein
MDFFLPTNSADASNNTTATTDQDILRNLRECHQDAHLDHCICVCAGCDRQKEAEIGPEPLHNFTDFERQSFRENAHSTSTFKERLHVFE